MPTRYPRKLLRKEMKTLAALEVLGRDVAVDGQGCKAVGAQNAGAALDLPLEVPGRLLDEVMHGVRVVLFVVRDAGVALLLDHAVPELRS